MSRSHMPAAMRPRVRRCARRYKAVLITKNLVESVCAKMR